MVLGTTIRGKFQITLEVSVKHPGHRIFSQKKSPVKMISLSQFIKYMRNFTVRSLINKDYFSQVIKVTTNTDESY